MTGGRRKKQTRRTEQNRTESTKMRKTCEKQRGCIVERATKIKLNKNESNTSLKKNQTQNEKEKESKKIGEREWKEKRIKLTISTILYAVCMVKHFSIRNYVGKKSFFSLIQPAGTHFIHSCLVDQQFFFLR